MLVYKASEADIIQAGVDAGVAIVNLRGFGRGYRFTLGLMGSRRYQRTSPSAFRPGRRIAAVCWHGHLAFMRALYSLAPEASIRTATARYDSAEELEDKKENAYYRNVGSQMYPMDYGQACTC